MGIGSLLVALIAAMASAASVMAFDGGLTLALVAYAATGVLVMLVALVAAILLPAREEAVFEDPLLVGGDRA